MAPNPEKANVEFRVRVIGEFDVLDEDGRPEYDEWWPIRDHRGLEWSEAIEKFCTEVRAVSTETFRNHYHTVFVELVKGDDEIGKFTIYTKTYKSPF